MDYVDPLMNRALRSLGVLAIAFVMSLLMGLAAYLLIGFFGQLIICRNGCVEAPLGIWVLDAVIGLGVVILATPALWVRWTGRRPFDYWSV